MVRNAEEEHRGWVTGPSGCRPPTTDEGADERGIDHHGESGEGVRQLPEEHVGVALPVMHQHDTRLSALAEPLLTADDVAALLRLPRSSVYEYARRTTDPLPCVRIGRHLAAPRPRPTALLTYTRTAAPGPACASRQSLTTAMRHARQL